MKKICCSTLLGILLISLLGGCGSDVNLDIVIPTLEKITQDASTSQEIQLDVKEESSSAEDFVSESDESEVEGEEDKVPDDEVFDFSGEPEAQPAVDEDKMPLGECIYCGKSAMYVSGAWCCQVCPAVYGEEDIIAANKQDLLFVGEYLDCDVNEPNLEIAKGDDGKYIVQIGIYRLATFSDGVGEVTEEGLNFTATDPAGNPISGVIIVNGLTATVTFTDSTWDNLEKGTSLQYNKSSNVPNIWEF